MLVVTGGAGFIGSNLIRALNARGRDDILVVEDMSDGRKCVNLNDCRICDYLDKDEWLQLVRANGALDRGVECVYHLGACVDTLCWDGRAMMAANFTFSRATLDYCMAHGIAMVYASTAAVYGNGNTFVETPACERPLNVYGYSKLVFDQYVRTRLAHSDSLIAGVRYFNVYGPREQHKGRMASVAWHWHRQLLETGTVRLFGPSHGFAAGEQRRDFVYVDDAVAVTLWLAARSPADSGIYNCGTGQAETFNAVAAALIESHGGGAIEYVDFPDELAHSYQSRTEAELSRLRTVGYRDPFRSVATGVREYLHWLDY